MPLIYVSEPRHFYTYELPPVVGAEVLIGSAPQCHLSLPGVDGLSEMHARIICQPQGYILEDLGSAYGTFANGVPIRSDFLRPGVEYRLGAASITLAAEGAPAPQQAQQPAPGQPAAAQAQQKSGAQGGKPVLKKKASPLKTGSAAAKAAGKLNEEDLNAAAKKYDRSRANGGSTATLIYVVLVLLAAFYAGIALHHWEKTGNPFPGLVSDYVDEGASPAAADDADEEPAADESVESED